MVALGTRRAQGVRAGPRFGFHVFVGVFIE